MPLRAAALPPEHHLRLPHVRQIWGSIFMLSLVTFVAGGTKMIAHLGVVFFIFVILTLLSMYAASDGG